MTKISKKIGEKMEINFDYCKREEWITYINDTIMPLMRVSSYLVSFNYYLNDYYTGILISEVLKNDTLKEKLLGGLSENGESSKRSLAEFYNSFFGWALADLRNYLLHQSEDINISIQTTKKETNFIIFTLSRSKSSRDIPGNLGFPAVTTITSESSIFDISEYPSI